MILESFWGHFRAQNRSKRGKKGNLKEPQKKLLKKAQKQKPDRTRTGSVVLDTVKKYVVLRDSTGRQPECSVFFKMKSPCLDYVSLQVIIYNLCYELHYQHLKQTFASGTWKYVYIHVGIYKQSLIEEDMVTYAEICKQFLMQDECIGNRVPLPHCL